MESWKMDQLLSPIVSGIAPDTYAVCFEQQSMKVVHAGELVFIEQIPAAERLELLSVLQQRLEAVDGTVFRLQRWKDGLEYRVEELEDGIDEAEMNADAALDFSPYDDSLYEDREIMIDDWETERDAAREKTEELEDQLETLRQFEYKLRFALQLIGSANKQEEE